MRKFFIRVAAVFLIIFLLLSAAEIFLRWQTFVQLDGFHDKDPWNSVLHHGKNKFVVKNYGSNCGDEKIKVLLIGDSWMEDEYLSGAIGEEFAKKTQKCVEAIDGGNSSYAPTIYLLKSRMGFEKFGKFDFIIVNIDETDIGDEWLRYRVPLMRDVSGEIVAVPYECDIASEFIWNAKLWAEDSRFYVVRLIKFAYVYNMLVPAIYKFTESPDLYSNLMQYVFAPDARSLYKREHRYFGKRLLEMVKEMSSFTAGPGSIYITHHPHLRGLVDKVDDGRLYLPIISEALVKLKKKSGVNILDARNHVAEIHGGRLLTDTFEAGDPFSHLIKNGAIRYGKWIGDQIALRITDVPTGELENAQRKKEKGIAE